MGDDGSSTGTEPEQHVQIPISGCKRSSRSSGARASKPAGSDRWVLFLEKFNLKLSQNKSGCSFCLKDCLLKIQPLLRELQHWREELAALPSEAQDKEIWWIFQKQAVSDTKPDKSRRCKNKVDFEEGFSTSTEGAENACADVGGSVSTSDPEGSSSSGSKNCGKVASAPARMRRQYAQRVGSKHPSVRIDRVLRGADCNACVCYAAALFIFGLGGQRVKRATCLFDSEIFGLEQVYLYATVILKFS